MVKVSKRMRASKEGIGEDEEYPLEDAVRLVKARSQVKFDESVDIAAVLGIDTRQSDQQVRGSTVLPHGTGKTVRVAVFAKGAKAEEAQNAEADVVGAEDLVEEIQGGRLDFDRCLATPDMMSLVGRLGKILGPRNMMPNPRLGTVTMDISTAVANLKGGAIVYRAEKAGIVHVLVGKVSFSEEALVENIRSVLEALRSAKPSGVKGTYMKGVSVSSTMGPSVRVVL